MFYSSSCPSTALFKLRDLAIKEGVFDPDKPVFAFKSSKNLTKTVLNKKLKELLGDFSDEFHMIAGHSFRAAIPSLISSHPDKSTVLKLKDWGNWELNSYRSYLRDVGENRKKLFSKIIDCMYLYSSHMFNKYSTLYEKFVYFQNAFHTAGHYATFALSLFVDFEPPYF